LPSESETALDSALPSSHAGADPSRLPSRGHFPLIAAWGLSPALLLAAGVCLVKIGGNDSAARTFGVLIGWVTFLGTPAILCALGTTLLDRVGVAGRGLVVAHVTAWLLLAANVVLALCAFVLIEVAF
jgi:hypothetical protein